MQKQNYSTCPREVYVDIEKACRDCGRPFLFFAQEQKYWFEELGFYVDADCVKCVECRKTEQRLKHLVREYEALINEKVRDSAGDERLSEVTQALFTMGYIRRPNKGAEGDAPTPVGK